MNVNTIRNILDNAGPRFITVQFVKKNGELRVMNCRTGVKKYLKGGRDTLADKPYLYKVYDVRRKAYRCVNLNTVVNIRMDGVDLEVNT